MMAKEMNKTEKMRKLFANKALDVEEMDAVAGGTYAESADDSCFLNVLLRGHPAQPDRHGALKLQVSYDSDNAPRYAEIKNAWKAVGVDVKIKDDDVGNKYSINGQKVTREMAMNHAMKVMGKQLQRSDWYWE